MIPHAQGTAYRDPASRGSLRRRLRLYNKVLSSPVEEVARKVSSTESACFNGAPRDFGQSADGLGNRSASAAIAEPTRLSDTAPSI